MDKIEKRWLTEFDEINRLGEISYIETAGMDTEQKKKKLEDDILDFLILAYSRGYRDTTEMLDLSFNFSIAEMQNSIYSRIDGKTWVERMNEHIANNDSQAIQTLIATEYHRVYNQASSAAGNRASQLLPTNNLVKTWHTMLDDKVRDTHKYLENITIPETDDFYTFDGDHASAPGNFEKAENNVGCRCILEHHRQGAMP